MIDILSFYKKENLISGRYITINTIKELIDNLIYEKNILGYSYLEKPIYQIKLGSGKKKILIWSQMHGNESTGTKAIFDLLHFFSSPNELETIKNVILENCSIIIIPILNPDGAELYTRENAQKIDLNRDAVDLKAPESRLLHQILHQFKPDYCFNLHDQRPFFSVGKENLPATLSFLAPSEDKERTITNGRKETMRVIVAMNKGLQKYIPNQIGRYTDEFYPTATGDNFQKAGFNTILIEAGHFQNDYEREITRKYNYLALLLGLDFIASNNDTNFNDYFNIPNIEKNYFEIMLSNVVLNGKKIQVGVYFKDYLFNNKIKFRRNFLFLQRDRKYNSKKNISKKLIFNKEDDLVFYLKKQINSLLF
jgi:hypothetical protein